MDGRHHLARVGADPSLLAQVAAEVAAWDPDSAFRTPGGSTAPMDHAHAILGILTAGGRETDLMGYLRRAEADALGVPRSTAEERRDRADRIARWMRAAVERAATG